MHTLVLHTLDDGGDGGDGGADGLMVYHFSEGDVAAFASEFGINTLVGDTEYMVDEVNGLLVAVSRDGDPINGALIPPTQDDIDNGIDINAIENGGGTLSGVDALMEWLAANNMDPTGEIMPPADGGGDPADGGGDPADGGDGPALMPIIDLAVGDFQEITADNQGLFIIYKDDNGTPADPSDDVFTAYVVGGNSTDGYTVDTNQPGIELTMTGADFDQLMAEATNADTIEDPFAMDGGDMNFDVYVFDQTEADAINGMTSLDSPVFADTAYMFDPDNSDGLLVEVEPDMATAEPIDDYKPVDGGASIGLAAGVSEDAIMGLVIYLEGDPNNANNPGGLIPVGFVPGGDAGGNPVDGGGDGSVGDGGGDTPPANPDYDKPLFEIVSVEEGSITGQEDLGGRFGAIETFGIRVIDNEDGTADSFDLSNIDLSIEWAEGDYVYWGRYEAGLNTPTGETTPAPGETALVQKNFANDTLGVEDNVLEWAMIDAGETGVTYSEGDYLATFMLERRDTDIDSDITLGTSQYNFVDDAAEGENFAVPRSPNAQDFNFEYSEDAVNIQVANERGEAAPKLKLYVSDNTVTDGLSIACCTSWPTS